MEQDLKDALKYISDNGYGSGTNWNTKLVAVLLANYRNKLSLDGDLADVSKCTCLQDCDNCGAKQVQFICSGSEVCSECFC